jgi:hypothetical protein
MGTPVDGEIGARRAKTMASDAQSHSEISVVLQGGKNGSPMIAAAFLTMLAASNFGMSGPASQMNSSWDIPSCSAG